MQFHSSLDDLMETFRNIIGAVIWLKFSSGRAITFFADQPNIVALPCSFNDESVKVEKSILQKIAVEGLNKEVPLMSHTLINFYRIFTIAAKDIIWDHTDFSSLRNKSALQFLYHLRNASAHNNHFYWGKDNSRERKRTIANLPISWHGKEINENSEGQTLYMDFLKPGDIFVLLSEISALAVT